MAGATGGTPKPFSDMGLLQFPSVRATSAVHLIATKSQSPFDNLLRDQMTKSPKNSASACNLSRRDQNDPSIRLVVGDPGIGVTNLCSSRFQFWLQVDPDPA